jgi:hypothetical protein
MKNSGLLALAAVGAIGVGAYFLINKEKKDGEYLPPAMRKNDGHTVDPSLPGNSKLPGLDNLPPGLKDQVLGALGDKSTPPASLRMLANACDAAGAHDVAVVLRDRASAIEKGDVPTLESMDEFLNEVFYEESQPGPPPPPDPQQLAEWIEMITAYNARPRAAGHDLPNSGPWPPSGYTYHE